MTDHDPLAAQLSAARPALPPALRARALRAGRTAWIPWWARLRTWSAAAAALLAIDLLAAWPAERSARTAPPPRLAPAPADADSLADLLIRQRELSARTWAYYAPPPPPTHLAIRTTPPPESAL